MAARTASFALITGATSGFGYEFVKLFAQDGYNLILVARDRDKLNAIAADISERYGVITIPLPKDLFDPTAAEELYQEVKANNYRVDVLVNDAGQGEHGPFILNDLQRELKIIQLNIISLVVLTKLFLQDMVYRGYGRVLQVASLLAKYPTPLMAVYGGTKAFVLSFSEAVTNELQGTGVSMTVMLPGASDTDFFNKAGAENTVAAKDTELSDPAEVAKDGHDALFRGDKKIISGIRNKIQGVVSNVLPDSKLAAQMRRQMEDKEEDY